MYKVGKIEDIPNEVTNFLNGGKCSNCGACCTQNLVMSETEFKRIVNYVNSKHIKEYRNLIPTVDRLFDITCPFRNNTTNTCMIYPVRPSICRIFKCDISQMEINKKMINTYGKEMTKLSVYNLREYNWGDQ